MRMYCSSAKYRDACESGKMIYASFYRTLLLLNQVQLRMKNIDEYLQKNNVHRFVLWGCNDVTEIFLKLCEKWQNKPAYIIEDNVSKYQRIYKNYKLVPLQDIQNDFDYVIVMSRYNFNQIAQQAHQKGIAYRQIISIEEFLAGLLCEGEDDAI